MANQIKRRGVALILAALLFLGTCACGNNTIAGYQISNSLGKNDFSIAFRAGDQLRDYVDAALSVLAARGTVHELAVKWFPEDPTTLEGDADALDAFEEIPRREFIMGLDPDAAPMSYVSGKTYSGFDVELAQQVCALLGWTLKYQEITPGDAVVELSAGNIDAAWGGMSFQAEEDEESYSLSSVYMENDLVLVSKADSNIKSLGKLKKKVLYTTTSAAANAVLEADEKHFSKIGEVVQSDSGARGCLEALSKDLCDAVAINSVSAYYYIK